MLNWSTVFCDKLILEYVRYILKYDYPVTTISEINTGLRIRSALFEKW